MSIEQKPFGVLPDGTKVNRIAMRNTNGAKVEFTEYGARILGIWVPDKNGILENVVLAHDTLEEYFSDYFSSIVGRYANRIGGASFELDGKRYPLTANENGNILHGGSDGLHQKVWRVKCCDNSDEAPSITFAAASPNGECGFPGNMKFTVRYTLSTDNALIIEYTATTDAPTVLNLTNHAYFNLTGNPAKSILNCELQIDADSYTEVSQALVPTGKLLSVEGTPEDFRKSKTIGQDIRSKADPLLDACGGYDHNFALNGSGMRKIAEAWDEASGRKMLVFTDQPGVQLYTTNNMPDGLFAQNHTPIRSHCAFCLETQHFPDAPNRPEFASAVLRPDEIFRSTTTYKFEIK